MSSAWLRRSDGSPAVMPPRDSIDDLIASRAWLDDLYADFVAPDGVTVTPLPAIPDVPEGGDLVHPQDGPSDPPVLSIHGGGWCSGSPSIDRPWTTLLAQRGATIWAPRYRLAPESPFPAAVHDCAAAVRAVADAARRAGRSPLLLGYSAGANLLLAGLVLLARRGQPVPTPRVLLAYGIFDWRSLTVDPSGRRRTVELWSEAYLGADADTRRTDELVSPVLAAEVLDGADVLITCGDRDRLLDQSCMLHDVLAARGDAPRLRIGEGLDHGFLKDRVMPEAERLRAEILAWALP